MFLKIIKISQILVMVLGTLLALSIYAHNRPNWVGAATFQWMPELVGGWPTIFVDSLPSLLFVVIFSGLSAFLNGPNRIAFRSSIARWTLVALIFEGLQLQALGSWKIPGVFDKMDLVFIVTGAVFCWLWAELTIKNSTSHSSGGQVSTRRHALLLSLGIVGSMATTIQTGNAYPQYLSYEELRSAVKLDKDVPFIETGKIYTYQVDTRKYLLVSARNHGIHFYDNTDPTAPEHIGFIHIPGNLDMEIRNGFLYADSYIDLVTIDLRDVSKVREIARQKDIFPYNPYQNISDEGVVLIDVDRQKGVVVGYTPKTKKGRTQ